MYEVLACNCIDQLPGARGRPIVDFEADHFAVFEDADVELVGERLTGEPELLRDRVQHFTTANRDELRGQLAILSEVAARLIGG